MPTAESSNSSSLSYTSASGMEEERGIDFFDRWPKLLCGLRAAALALSWLIAGVLGFFIYQAIYDKRNPLVPPPGTAAVLSPLNPSNSSWQREQLRVTVDTGSLASGDVVILALTVAILIAVLAMLFYRPLSRLINNCTSSRPAPLLRSVATTSPTYLFDPAREESRWETSL